jgi:hypothetical protein
MSGYGPKETWKVVYVPKVMNGGMRGVALVEAENRQQAMFNFMNEYAGQFHTVETCQKLLG